MSNLVSFSKLREASPKERERLLSGLIEGARMPANGRAKEIDARIKEFERKYELPSVAMLAGVESGSLRETEEIASWLMLIKLRERLERADTR